MTQRVIRSAGSRERFGMEGNQRKTKRRDLGIFINTASRCICKGIDECELEEMVMMQRNGHIVIVSLNAAS